METIDSEHRNLRFKYNGYDCLVAWVNDSHYCGYVGVPEIHPAYGLEYFQWSVDTDKIDREFIINLPVIRDIGNIRVHGGLTFAGQKVGDFISTDEMKWYFGFDAAHAGDLTKSTMKYKFEGDVFRTRDYMESECRSLADQLKEIENKYEGAFNGDFNKFLQKYVF